MSRSSRVVVASQRWACSVVTFTDTDTDTVHRSTEVR
jgi:hypothetical protein